MFLVPLNDKTTINLDKLMKFQDGDRSLALVSNKIFRIAEDHQRFIIQALEDDIKNNPLSTWVKFGSGVTSVYVNNIYVVEVRDFLKYTQIALSDTVIQLRETEQRDYAMTFYQLLEPTPVPEGVIMLSMDELQAEVEVMPVEVLSDGEVVQVEQVIEKKPKAAPKAQSKTSTKKTKGKA